MPLHALGVSVCFVRSSQFETFICLITMLPFYLLFFRFVLVDFVSRQTKTEIVLAPIKIHYVMYYDQWDHPTRDMKLLQTLLSVFVSTLLSFHRALSSLYSDILFSIQLS